MNGELAELMDRIELQILVVKSAEFSVANEKEFLKNGKLRDELKREKHLLRTFQEEALREQHILAQAINKGEYKCVLS